MNNKIFYPNLPQNRINHCLIGSKYSEEIKELTELNIKCLQLKENHLLDEEINSHADILSFNFGNGKILLNKASIGESDLKKLGFEIIETDIIKSPYPDDISLNAALIKNKIVCNSKFVAEEILHFARENGIEVINTKQGYSRCSLCIVKENAVITEDSSLAYLLKKCQFDVLQINPGHIYLSDKHYGFIGGASAKLSKTEIYFSGDLKSHPDYCSIIQFLSKYNVNPIFSTERRLRDFGGIVSLTESVI